MTSAFRRFHFPKIRSFQLFVGGACATSSIFVVSTVALAAPIAPSSPPTAPRTAPPTIQKTANNEQDWPQISLEEVSKHQTAESLWVTYEGYVYDVTPFLDVHPGGRELLLTAGGMDLHHFFTNYTVHTQSAKAMNYLESMRVGRLSSSDAAKAKADSTTEKHVDARRRVLSAARRRLVLVVLTAPIWLSIRFVLQVVGLFLPFLVHRIASVLPISTPGYGQARALPPSRDGVRTQIAVVGGGIAGCGCAYALSKAGYEVTLYEGRNKLGGNARAFDWDVLGKNVTSCVSVTAWDPELYKNYYALLNHLNIKQIPIHLSWFINSRVPGHEGFLWAADPEAPEGSLRRHFAKDFRQFGRVLNIIDTVTNILSFRFWGERSMYSLQSGLGVLNPFATFPLHHMCRLFGVSQEWWDIVFTPHYTASLLTDKLDNMVCVAGPVLHDTIPLNPTPKNSKDRVLTSCLTWENSGAGLRTAFQRLTKDVEVKLETRVLSVEESSNGKVQIFDEHGESKMFDRVVFACPVNAVGNMMKGHNWIEDSILSVPEYADDYHPSTGHMHSIIHNDASIIAPEFREEVLKSGSNYVEVTRLKDGSLNIENTYNFGVQTPSVVGLPLDQKVPMLITHALGEGKTIDPKLIRGEGNHARAHPLYSGWNLAALLSLRFIQGSRGMYFCSNYTTPGNCHDMSLLSGLSCAHAIGAPYLFEENESAKKDFNILRSLMGI